MRTAIFSALAVLLWLICLPNRAAAQTSLAGPLTQLSLLPNPPSGAQAPSLPKGGPEHSGVFKRLPSNQASALRELSDRAAQLNPFPDGHWKDRSPYLYGVQPRADARSCAHILIRRMPNADSSMVKRMPGGTPDQMSVTTGLPVCPEDIR